MNKSTFHISGMDCSSEEQLIRMKLDGFDNIQYLSFDLPNRKLRVYHSGEITKIQQAIQELHLSDRLESTIEEDAPLPENASLERKILWWVLGINLGLFYRLPFSRPSCWKYCFCCCHSGGFPYFEIGKMKKLIICT